jgi:hypothetical protein
MRPLAAWTDYVIADRACWRCGLRRSHAGPEDCIRDLREIICWLQNGIERLRRRKRSGAEGQQQRKSSLRADRRQTEGRP